MPSALSVIEAVNVRNSIVHGDMDDELDSIQRAVQVRKQYLADSRASRLRVGGPARFTESIRPRYLAGLEVTVTKINQKSIIVSCPSRPMYGRFSGARNVRVANAIIEPIASAETAA
jgi:hypothetical protein